MARLPVGAKATDLDGSGVSIGDTTAKLSALTDIYGVALAMSDFGDKAFGTSEPGTDNEESITFTGITIGADGKPTLTGIKSVLSKSPYTEVSGFLRGHSGGTRFVISNSAAFMDGFVSKNSAGTVDETLTFDNDNIPRLDDVGVYGGGTEEYLATKRYVDSTVAAGAPDASTTTKGVAKLTTAPTSPTDPIAVGATDVTATPTASKIPRADASNKLAQGWLDLTANFVFSGIVDITANLWKLGGVAFTGTMAQLNGAVASSDSIYGDGSNGDGNITSGTTTLAKDTYYNDLTIAVGATLNPNGWRVFVKGTLTNNGTITRAGNNGGNGAVSPAGPSAGGQAGGAGGTAGAALTGNSLAGGNAGVAGGNGALSTGISGTGGAGNAGAAGVAQTASLLSGVAPAGGASGAGGLGGAGAAGAGAIGGASATTTITTTFPKSAGSLSLLRDFIAGTPYQGGASAGGGAGGGGGGGGTNAANVGGGGGGGSGGNGGVLAIFAKTIVNGATGVITVKGGTGGNGAAGQANPTNTGGGSGGAGGGSGGTGGVIVLVYHTLTNTGSLLSTGGTAGTAGAVGTGSGGGSNGVAGSNGSTGLAGVTLQYQF